MVGLALIPLVVPPEHLGWARWWAIIIGLAALGVAAIFVQSLIQSSEDHKRDRREQERDTKFGEMLGIVKKLSGIDADSAPPAVPVAQALVENIASPLTPDIDGEVYRIALSPRTMSWELIRDIYRIQGHADEAKVDCDVLVEMYLVNPSKNETRYVRDLRLSAEVDGSRVILQRQEDLRAMDLLDKEYEYGLKESKGEDTEPVKQLFSALPVALAPTQPIEGWVRFLIEGVNPDKITEKSWHLSVVDSLGNEYPITKIGQKERKGEVALRRLRA